jgi:hypothetical protein
MSKKHVCKEVHPGVSHESWSKEQQKEINKTIENPTVKTNPSDTSKTTTKNKFEIAVDIKEKAREWLKKNSKVKPMELKYGGKTKKSSKGSSGRYSQYN